MRSEQEGGPSSPWAVWTPDRAVRETRTRDGFGHGGCTAWDRKQAGGTQWVRLLDFSPGSDIVPLDGCRNPRRFHRPAGA